MNLSFSLPLLAYLAPIVLATFYFVRACPLADAAGQLSARRAPPVYHYYCSSDLGQPVIYFSAAFDTTSGTAASAAFKRFLEEKYSYRSRTVGTPCFGNYPSLAAVREAEEKRMAAMRTDKRSKTVATGWTYVSTEAASAPAPPAPGAAPSPTLAQPNPGNPPARSVFDDPRLSQFAPELRPAVAREAANAKPYCETNATLMRYDCSCFARKVFEARLKAGASRAYGPGGKVRGLSPPFGVLVMKMDLTDCRRH